MTKGEYLEVLIPQLERLERIEHLTHLALKEKYYEVDEILEKSDYAIMYSAMKEYMENEENEAIDIHDIPKAYYITFTIYLTHSCYNEDEVMECWEELMEELQDCGELGKKISVRLENIYINAYRSFALFMNCTSQEDIVD